MFETTLVFGDFFWIAFIVMIFGGGTTYMARGSDDNDRLDLIIKKLETLEGGD